jgi:peptidoglycan DL-endopeptidase CwlS
MNFRKLLISGVLCTAILAGSTAAVYAQSPTYIVQKGDTYWIISQKLNVSIQSLMSANNATQNTVINVGQSLIVPQSTTLHTVKAGETYWIISNAYGVNLNDLLALNGANANSYLYIGQQIKIPAASSSTVTPPTPAPAPTPTAPYITYKSYTVQKGDILWNLANKFGIPLPELLKANSLSESSWVNVGDILKIPVHNIPVKVTPGPQYGEALDWWTEAQYVVPVGSDFEVVDFYTGKSFKTRRTTGANHADCETLTLADTNMMKEVWGGSFSWTSRPVLIKFNGRQIAASMSSMPHAGNDAAAGGVWTSWRSGNYGAGSNFDWVKNNGIDGHFDIHFLNSTTHNTGEINVTHQQNVKTAAGIK